MYLHLCMNIIHVILFIALHMLMLCLNYCCQLWWSTPSCFLYCSFFLFYSYIESISFFGLEGTCCVTTPRIATPNGFILPFKYFWGQSTNFPNFLFCFDPSPMSNMFFTFSIIRGDPIKAPFLLFKTSCSMNVTTFMLHIHVANVIHLFSLVYHIYHNWVSNVKWYFALLEFHRSTFF